MLTSTGEHPSGTVAGLEANTLADGFFHLATWVVVFAATVLAVRAWRRGELAPPWRVHFGLMLAGWGAFNLVEGLIDHELLGIHHVRDDLGGPIGWDLGFLAFGAALVLGGLALSRTRAVRMTKWATSRRDSDAERSLIAERCLRLAPPATGRCPTGRPA